MLPTMSRDYRSLQSAANLLHGSARGIPAAGSGAASGSGCLADVLLDDCAWNVRESTKPPNFVDSKMMESLHPYFPQCNYEGEVVIDGARGIVMAFDPATALGPGAQLTLMDGTGKVLRKIDRTMLARGGMG